MPKVTMGMKSERTVLMITGHSIGRNAQSSWSINVWTVHQRDFHETQPGQDAAAIETLLITLGQIWCPAEIWWFDDFNLSHFVPYPSDRLEVKICVCHTHLKATFRSGPAKRCQTIGKEKPSQGNSKSGWQAFARNHEHEPRKYLASFGSNFTYETRNSFRKILCTWLSRCFTALLHPLGIKWQWTAWQEMDANGAFSQSYTS